ncbi:RHS repeat-associated core domain-containing protein [Streptomyces sp. NPDC017056]|uniref:RHS repeat-associated core domain-containing protein n=1 Tax=Streptomyces sp. NPDC017056 TaxID=3364973 RepID=UPI0037B422A1
MDCPLRFPGQYHDEESGLRYNYFRYYSPDTASYLSPDPLGLRAAPNHHAYVVNPLSWADPLGLESCPDDPSLEEAKKKAFRDAGDPWGQEPVAVDDWVPATTPEWQGSKQLFDKEHNPIYFPEETHLNDRGDFVVFQNHWTGHREPGENGYQRPHIHMRPIEDTRNSNYEGCEEHYYYDPNLG